MEGGKKGKQPDKQHQEKQEIRIPVQKPQDKEQLTIRIPAQKPQEKLRIQLPVQKPKEPRTVEPEKGPEKVTNLANGESSGKGDEPIQTHHW